MRLPEWLRVRRAHRHPEQGRVTVTITADTSQFMAAMDRAAEVERAARYRRRIAHERSIGEAQVGVLLDNMCRDIGLDPVTTWRLPRADEQRARRDRSAYHAAAYFGAAVQAASDLDSTMRRIGDTA